jgi:hypothetical protein
VFVLTSNKNYALSSPPSQAFNIGPISFPQTPKY